MEFIKTTKCAAVAMLVAATGLFADEVPDARQFAEVSREIWKNTTAINTITENFNKGEEDQETIRQTKLNVLKNAAEEFRELLPHPPLMGFHFVQMSAEGQSRLGPLQQFAVIDGR